MAGLWRLEKNDPKSKQTELLQVTRFVKENFEIV
jgi:hypothetical protein